MHAIAAEPVTAPRGRSARRLPLTRIIATLGPASDSVEAMTRLVEAGARVLRLNFSHGSLEDHGRRLATAREVERRVGRPIAVLGDLQGPKIRVGTVPNDGIEIETGRVIEFRRGEFDAFVEDESGRAIFSSTYENLVEDVDAGQRLLINDGAVRTLVVERHVDRVVCTVTHGGKVTTRKGINLPDSSLTVRTLTEADVVNAKWAVRNGIDLLALSFVRRGRDIEDLRAVIREEADSGAYPIPIIAKIEVPQAISHIDEILDSCQAMMVARGDLGVEMDIAEVPLLQRHLIERARHHGRPVIVATQMLESMITAPTPTRAEASDVASAIFDHVDATMLSGETAVGKWPIVTVEQMRRITSHVERWQAENPGGSRAPERLRETRHPTAALAHGVWTVSQDLGAACVVIWSETGGGAMYLSRHDFGVPIVVVTSNQSAARRMQLLRGVLPVRMDVPATFDDFLAELDILLPARGLARRGDPVVVVAGEPLGAKRITNRVAVHTLGRPGEGSTGPAGNNSRRR